MTGIVQSVGAEPSVGEKTGVVGVRFQIAATCVGLALVFAGLWTMLKIAFASSVAETPVVLTAALNRLVHAEDVALDVLTQVARIFASA